MIHLTTRYLRIACFIVGLAIAFTSFICALQRDVSIINSTTRSTVTWPPVILDNPIPATVPGSSDPSGDEWPMFRGSLNHTGIAKTTLTWRSRPFWSYNGTESTWSTPAVTGGRAYVAGYAGKILCLNATTGTVFWSYDTKNSIGLESPAIADGRLFEPSGHKLYCLNATTGSSIWNYTLGEYGSSPVIWNNRVYICSDKFYCLNATTGVSLWNYTCYGVSSPSINSGFVYFDGVIPKAIYRLDAITGNLDWSRALKGAIHSSIAISSGFLYAGVTEEINMFQTDGRLYSINANTGAFIWNSSLQTPDPICSSPTVVNGHVFIGSPNGKFYCFDSSAGSVEWQFQASGKIIYSSSCWSNGRVYFTDDSVTVGTPKFYCLNDSNGNMLWKIASSSGCSPAVAGGRVYIGGYTSALYSLPLAIV